MKPILIFMLLLALAPAGRASYDAKTGWIVNEHWKSGVPLGGIGVGKVEVFTDGSFGRATINHNWDRPTGVLKGAYAEVQVVDGGRVVNRVLRLPAPNGEYKDAAGNVTKVAYRGTFPSAELAFRDPDLPVKIDLHAWSSLIPNNAKDSSLPVAHLDYTLVNPSKRLVVVTLMLAWPNILGFGGRQGSPEWTSFAGNYQAAVTAGNAKGLIFKTTQNYRTARQNVVGQYFVGVANPDDTLQTLPRFDPENASITIGAGGNILLAGAGPGAPLAVKEPAGAVAMTVTVGPGESTTIPFVIAWAMPTHRLTHKSVVGYSPGPRDDKGVSLMLDRNPDTRWTTDRAMLPGDALEITLPKARALGILTLDSKASASDWPRGYRVDTASNGAMSVAAEATKGETGRAAKSGVLGIDLRGTTANRIRITNLGVDGYYFWSIHELGLTDLDGNEITLTPDSVHAYLSRPIYKEDSDDNVGHYWQNAFLNATEIASYAVNNAGRLWRSTEEWQKHIAASNLPAWFQRQMENAAFPAFSNTVFTKDGRFSVLESPVDMGGALGTMDQRMAAHALWIQFFHEQDIKELDMFARAQDMTPQKDGRIPHFVGNVHETIGDPNVGYGVTDWPDLSASWIMQTLKEYRWTGNLAFLKRNLPHIEKAVAFLRSQDHDGDGIPEGGSTYDYEHLPPGAFIYSASCTLGALRAAIAAEREAGNSGKAAEYEKQFSAVQAATMRRLWTGTHFRKWASPDGGKVDNTFVASLAGDWLAQLCGLPRTLPTAVVNAEIANLLKHHLWAFNPVPPTEVKPDGTAFTNTCFLIQHQPYLGDEAIYQGYADDGMEVQRRVYDVTWEMNDSPWDESLIYDAPSGRKGGLVSYMTCPATWHTLNALTGASLDIPNRTLYLAPHIPTSMGELHVPVFFPTFWARVDAVPATRRLTITVLKTFGVTPSFTTVRGDVDGKPIKLRHALTVREGETWRLSVLWDQLVTPTKGSLQPIAKAVAAPKMP